MRGTRVVILTLALLLIVLAGACDGEATLPTVPEDGTTVPESPEETAPPETTLPETPDEGDGESPEEDADSEGSIPPWVWIVGLLALVGLISWAGARSGSRRSSAPVPPIPADPATPSVHRALGEAKWLHDSFDPLSVVAFADATYDFTTHPDDGEPPASQDWDAIPSRVATARSNLTAAAGATPNPAVATACTQLISGLDATHAAVQRLHQARVDRRAADDRLPHAKGSEEARGAEQRATDDLGLARSSLAAEIDGASAVLER